MRSDILGIGICRSIVIYSFLQQVSFLCILRYETVLDERGIDEEALYMHARYNIGLFEVVRCHLMYFTTRLSINLAKQASWSNKS